MPGVRITLSPGLHAAEGDFSYEINSSVRLTDLLEQWSSRDAPGAADKIMDRENGCIAAAVLILLNGRSVKSEDPETVLISPGDSIKIMPILLGG